MIPLYDILERSNHGQKADSGYWIPQAWCEEVISFKGPYKALLW